MSGPSPDLFRSEAIRHHLQAEEARGLVRVAPPWTWALLGAALCGVVTALVAAWVGHVEVTGRARGILRPRSGVRVEFARLEGTVGRIEARSGQEVKAGQVLVRLEAATVQAGLLEAERQLEMVRNHFDATTRLQDLAHADQSRRLGLRRVRLGEQIHSQRQSVALAQAQVQRYEILLQEGIQSPAEVDKALACLAQARSRMSQSEHELEQVAQERAALDQARQDTLWQRRLTIRNAEVRVESLSLMQDQGVHKALEDGTVEAMLVRPGERVHAGQALCKVIPRNVPLHVVAFLEEKDRAFACPGDVVVLELDQLPYSEYGTARARVERISDDLASGFEIQEAFGEARLGPSPTYRVELCLIDTQPLAKAGTPLRSGMLLNARFKLRRERLITLVLAPLRKWFH